MMSWSAQLLLATDAATGAADLSPYEPSPAEAEALLAGAVGLRASRAAAPEWLQQHASTRRFRLDALGDKEGLLVRVEVRAALRV